MRIGFDAKRAYTNHTGLGNYSRTLLQSLFTHFPEHTYKLYTPKRTSLFSYEGRNVQPVVPTQVPDRLFPSLWRSWRICDQLSQQLDLYHGLSNELPYGLHKRSLRKVVTIHDLLFLHFPEQYPKTDHWVYQRKFRYACHTADLVIATSEATRQDIEHTYNIPSNQIRTIYQSCDPRFYLPDRMDLRDLVRRKYGLHQPYFLTVGSLIARKNIGTVLEALLRIPQQDIRLVIIGKGKNSYAEKLKQFIKIHQLENRVLFLEEHYPSSEILADLPALYQAAVGLIYPSIKEGYGIPVLEAMAAGTAVITTAHSSMAEISGEAALLSDPFDADQIALFMSLLYEQPDERIRRITEGKTRAQQLDITHSSAQLMQHYLSLF